MSLLSSFITSKLPSRHIATSATSTSTSTPSLATLPSTNQHAQQNPIYSPPPAPAPATALKSTHTFTPHTAPLTALTLSPSTAHLLTASHDQLVKITDFHGTDRRTRAFREITVLEGNAVTAAKYDARGKWILTAAGGVVKVYQNGEWEEISYAHGDPYLRDQRLTAGHIGQITDVDWNPKSSDSFLSAASDGTVRIWDAENTAKNKHVIVVKAGASRSMVVSCAKWTHDGRIIAASQDGAIRIWKESGPFQKAPMSNEKAYPTSVSIASIDLLSDGHTLITRGPFIKKWDLRKFNQSLGEIEIPTLYEDSSNCSFSADEKYFAAGTSSKIDKNKICIIETASMCIAKEYETSKSVTRCLWSSALNQIFVGESDGSVEVLYSPEHSTKGIMLCKDRAVKTATIEQFMADQHAVAAAFDPEEAPQSHRHQTSRESARHAPEKPISGLGKGGRIGGNSVQAIMATLIGEKDRTRDQDPREALMKYADKIGTPKYVTGYSETQPVGVYDSSYLKEDEERQKEAEERKKRRKIQKS